MTLPTMAHGLVRTLNETAIRPLLSPWRRGRVAMFHIGRSGSSVLANMIARDPAVFWDGEIYEKLFRKWERANHEFRVGDPAPLFDPVRHLRRRVLRGGLKWYGFEVKFFHLAHGSIEIEDYLNQLRALGFEKFIVLERKNYLKKIVSSLVARQVGRYHIESTEKTSLRKVSVSTQSLEMDRQRRPLIDFLDGYRDGFSRLRAALSPGELVEISYENHIQADPSRAYQKSAVFLGLTTATAKPNLGRTNPYSLRDQIENFDEISDYLRGSMYEWMLFD